MIKYGELTKKAAADKEPVNGMSDLEQARMAYGIGGAVLGGGGGYLLGRLIHGRNQSALSKLLYALGGAGAGGALAYNYNPRTLAAAGNIAEREEDMPAITEAGITPGADTKRTEKKNDGQSPGTWGHIVGVPAGAATALYQWRTGASKDVARVTSKPIEPVEAA